MSQKNCTSCGVPLEDGDSQATLCDPCLLTMDSQVNHSATDGLAHDMTRPQDSPSVLPSHTPNHNNMADISNAPPPPPPPPLICIAGCTYGNDARLIALSNAFGAVRRTIESVWAEMCTCVTHAVICLNVYQPWTKPLDICLIWYTHWWRTIPHYRGPSTIKKEQLIILRNMSKNLFQSRCPKDQIQERPLTKGTWS